MLGVPTSLDVLFHADLLLSFFGGILLERGRILCKKKIGIWNKQNYSCKLNVIIETKI